jgi:hypothetical protein
MRDVDQPLRPKRTRKIRSFVEQSIPGLKGTIKDLKAHRFPALFV